MNNSKAKRIRRMIAKLNPNGIPAPFQAATGQRVNPTRQAKKAILRGKEIL